MSIRTLKRWALLLTFWVAMQSKVLRATPITGDTVSGNFTATGTADIQGVTLSLGMRSDNSNPGWAATYTDGSNAYVDFLLSRSSGTWRWSQNAGSSSKLQLTLDNNNKLILFDQSSTPVAKITLNPLGTSTFAGSVTLSGTDNEMPNQTLVNSHSVLTEGLADSRYLSRSIITTGSAYNPLSGGTGPTLSLNGGTATGGAYSFAEGQGSTASSYFSTAMGSSTASGPFSTALGYSTASGDCSTAIGLQTAASGDGSTALGTETIASGEGSTALGGATTASGDSSTAMGTQTTASGTFSTALGVYTTASGYSSTAMGYFSTAIGKYSTAMGFYTTAKAYADLTLGQFNVGSFATGGDTSWISTDPLLELGNGTDASHLSDALIVYKNGNTAVQGSLTTGGTISAPGINSTGTVTASGIITAPTVIITAPAGDIPMFTGY